VQRDTYFVYGLLIGIETKIIVAFRKDKPSENERVQQVCNEVYRIYTEDQLNPFQSHPYSPSQNMLSRLNTLLERN